MPHRILVAGGLRESGPWDAFARLVGEHLAEAGVAVAFPWSSQFGRALVEGYLKREPAPAPGTIRAFAADGEPPSALAPFVVGAAGEDGTDDALRESDAVLLAGNGGGLPDLYRRAVRRHVPVVPLPIDRSTSEDLWEEALRRPPRPFPNEEARSAFFAIRHPDPRSAKTATTLGDLLVALARAPELPTGPRVLVLAHADPSGEDALGDALRRALRAAAPGARVHRGADGWLRSPGRALEDAVLAADVLVVDVSAGGGALYALGIARGARHAAVALARRGDAPAVDPGAVGALVWEDALGLAVTLEERIRRELKAARPPSAGASPSKPKPKSGRKRRRRRGRTPRSGRGGEKGGDRKRDDPDDSGDDDDA